MSFTYDFVNNPTVANVRLLVFDTNGVAPYPIWQDEEINAALQVFSSQGIIVGLSGFTPRIPVPQTYSYRRTAAMLLRGLAANQARMATVGLLDAKVNGKAAADALRAIATDYVVSEENDGFFAVSEMVVNNFSMRERLTAMLYRQNC
jgi:hypothetical protein